MSASPPSLKVVRATPTQNVAYTQYPSTSGYQPEWDIKRVRQALSDHEAGSFYSSAKLVEAMLRDPDIAGLLNARIDTALSCEFRIIPAVDVTHQDSCDYVAAECEKVWPTVANEATLRSCLQNIIMLGFGLAQVTWDEKWIPKLHSWYAQNTYWRQSTTTQDGTVWIARTREGEVEVDEVDPHWCLFAPGGRGAAWKDGLVLSLAEPWVAGQYALRDWLRYSERHGMPLIKAMIPATAKKEDKQGFVNAVAKMGSDPVIGLPQGVDGENDIGFDIQLLEASANTWEGFEALANNAKSKTTRRIAGGDLDEGGGGLGSGQAAAKEKLRLTVGKADARKLAASIREVLKFWAEWHFGNAEWAPTIEVVLDTPEDKEARAKLLLSVGQSLQALLAANVPVDSKEYCKQFDIPTTQTVSENTAPIYAYHLQYGIVTPNEVRASMGLPPRADGNNPTQVPASAPVTQASLTQADAAPADDTAEVTLDAPPVGQEVPPAAAAKPARSLPSIQERRALAVDGINYVDLACVHARAEGAKIVKPEIRGIFAALSTAKSYDDIRSRLVRELKMSDPAALQTHVGKLKALALLAGVHSRQ